MAKEPIIINNESALLEYLYFRLENGITDGISEEEYYKFINTLMQNINNDTSPYDIKSTTIDKLFSDIVEKAIDNTSSQYKKEEKGLYFENGIIYPNYNLREPYYYEKLSRMIRMPSYGTIGNMKRKTLEQMKAPLELSKYSLENSSTNHYELAKIVGAYFINDLIQRYIRNRIELKYWPSQCGDIDEYIFNRNIAKVIDENGTKENFELAYMNAIRVVAQMLDNMKNQNEKLMFSNNRSKSLAYANFLKLVLPKEISFLRGSDYKEGEFRSLEINVTITENQAQFNNSQLVFSDPYSEFSDDYKTESGSIGKNPVLIMEKRIGKVQKI